jgi:uncharacterized membrane protein YesL
MNIFLVILITIVLLFMVMLLVFCGYQLYSYIIDDFEKRERKKLRQKQEEQRYGK